MRVTMMSIGHMAMFVFNLRMLMFMRVGLIVSRSLRTLVRMMLVSMLVAMFMGYGRVKVHMPMLFIQDQQCSRNHQW